ncbi:hypothetical protein A2833_00770 [Candidatus Azambacteria bacterium RIFCSPHIGHO2_01_FULL_44_55]|uniref:Glycosyltransferase RgtA/B/C/D-like domain-containing protein n=1 Tax=Candidatus Azambacteria bacterium RIFCSPLOWO2_02_FULL_44_14 TaxID=1797306 RepID=A0A1F5CCB4_9BACT|nr:MAG: hypothetical protein A3I30_00780 [Candidatus Azambacteria bacterium RIFCSPLOWO2_02_FULL_44_14]OGD40823.1 MAG: hypothetical protein A2833_00770 [Candidatus Azambacteria bacterium RIFCSPHIGHO2_01_FULL_44_55]
MDFIKTHKLEIFGLAAILLIASFFYFYQITQKGFFYYDEAFYMLNANTYAKMPRLILDYATGTDSLQNLTTKYLPGVIFFQTTIKPAYILLNTLGISIFGHHDFSAFIVNGLVSLGALIVLYFIAQRVTASPAKSFLVALFFTVSGYQIFYARSGRPTPLAGLFMLLGALFYIKSLNSDGRIIDSKMRWVLLASGFFWSLMFMSHYNTFLILFSVGIFEIFLFIKNKSTKILFWRVIYLLVPFIGALVFIQTLTLLRDYLLVKAGYPRGVESYFSELRSLVTELIGIQAKEKRNYWFYISMIKTLNGWPYLILFLISPLIFFYKKWYLNLPLAFIFFITFSVIALASMGGLTLTRNIASVAGFMSLVVALVFFEILHFFKGGYRTIGFLIFSIILFSQIQINWEVINLKSGFKKAAQFLAAQDLPTEDIYAQAWPIFAFYLDRKVQIIDRNPETIHYVADWGAENPLYSKAVAQGNLLASFDNPMVNFLAVRSEVTLRAPSMLESDKIKIYKVKMR